MPVLFWSFRRIHADWQCYGTLLYILLFERLDEELELDSTTPTERVLRFVLIDLVLILGK